MGMGMGKSKGDRHTTVRLGASKLSVSNDCEALHLCTPTQWSSRIGHELECTGAHKQYGSDKGEGGNKGRYEQSIIHTWYEQDRELLY